MAGPSVDAPEDLYGVAPDEFVAARDDLARRLRAEGRRDEAAAVAGLRRPSATAWALNQVARHDPDLLGHALAAGARLRSASDAALAGDASELRRATGEERAATDAVVDAAAARLGRRGPAARTRLAATLRAAVLDVDVGDELRRGVLAADHDVPGFGFAAADDGAPTPARRARPKRADPGAAQEAQAERERRRRARDEADVARLERRAERLDREATRAEAAAAAARAAADQAASEAAERRRALRRS